jgi:hypothetical protein
MSFQVAVGVRLLSFFIRDAWMPAAAADIAGWKALNPFRVHPKGTDV